MPIKHNESQQARKAAALRRRAGWSLLSASLILAGCAEINEWLNTPPGGAPPEQEAVLPDTGNGYLLDMFHLVRGDPVTQAEIYADAESAARLTPGTSSRLRYALVLATPGHTGSNAERAQDILRELLSQPELLTPVELSLATIHLGEVEERLTLNAETRRLRAASTRAANSEERAAAARMAAIESENRQLRQSLAEAQEKLEAITSIERSIREQTENSEQ